MGLMLRISGVILVGVGLVLGGLGLGSGPWRSSWEPTLMLFEGVASVLIGIGLITLRRAAIFGPIPLSAFQIYCASGSQHNPIMRALCVFWVLVIGLSVVHLVQQKEP
jgi:hypothetical protein